MLTVDDNRLGRLMDRNEIRDLVSTYSMLVDQKRMDQFVELFTEDCVVDFKSSRSGGPLHGKAQLATFMKPLGDGQSFRQTSHHNSYVLVEFGDDEHAVGTTSLYAWHQTTDGREMELWGRYDDEFVKTPEGWKFKSRTIKATGQRWTTTGEASARTSSG